MQHMHNLLENTVDVVDFESPAQLRYRAATVDQAVAEATSDLGCEVEVLEASRIRRGGVGGFFATDLGVEIVVTPDTPKHAVREPHASAVGGSVNKPYNQSDDVADELGAIATDRTATASPTAATTHAAAATIDVASFARHFAREMALETPEPEPVRTPAPDPEPPTPAPATPTATPAAPTATSAPATPAPATPTAAPEAAAPAATPAPTPAAPAATVEMSKAVTPVVDEARNAPMPAAKPRARRDPLRRPTELVAGAIDSLVSRLSETAPVDGSRLQDLRRVTVRLTTSDGTVIEMAADLGDH